MAAPDAILRPIVTPNLVWGTKSRQRTGGGRFVLILTYMATLEMIPLTRPIQKAANPELAANGDAADHTTPSPFDFYSSFTPSIATAQSTLHTRSQPEQCLAQLLLQVTNTPFNYGWIKREWFPSVAADYIEELVEVQFEQDGCSRSRGKAEPSPSLRPSR